MLTIENYVLIIYIINTNNRAPYGLKDSNKTDILVIIFWYQTLSLYDPSLLSLTLTPFLSLSLIYSVPDTSLLNCLRVICTE